MPQNLASPYPLKLYHPNDPPSPCFIMLIKMIILRTRTRIKMIILMMMLMRTTTMTRMMQNLAAGSQTWLLHHHTCLRLTCWLFLSWSWWWWWWPRTISKRCQAGWPSKKLKLYFVRRGISHPDPACSSLLTPLTLTIVASFPGGN